jgi:hypothetical protein
MSPPPTSIDGTDITGATIDGQEVKQITVDGDTVFTAFPDSLISHYKFEQNVLDSVGENDLTNNGSGAFTTASKFGDFAKSYDGSDDFDSIESDIVNESGPFSVSLFVKTTSGGDVYNQGNSGTNEDFHRLFVETVAKFSVRSQTSPSDDVRISGTIDIEDGNYHHIVATYDSPEMQLFTDGGDKQTGTQSNVPNTNRSAFGALYRPSPALFFTGDIDHAKIYSKVLTDTEVSNLSNTGSI